MRKVDMVSPYRGLVAKRLYAATLACTIATSWAIPASFGQEGKPVEATAAVKSTGETTAAVKVAPRETALLGKYWLGLGLKKIEGDLATYLGNDKGMLIFEIYPDSPAAKAGWQVGDILISFNGKDIGDLEALLNEINVVESKSVKCILLRKGEKLSKKITPEVRTNAVPQIELNSNQSWTFEVLPEQAAADASGKKTMIFRAVPSQDGSARDRKGAVFMIEGGESDGETVVDKQNVSVSVVRKSDEEPGTYTVIIDGKKFEGSLDKLNEASERVKKALENLDVQTQQKKDEPNSKSAVVTESRIVIASTDENGEVKVIELDGGNVVESMKLDDMSKLIDKLPEEVRKKMEEAKKKAEAVGKKTAIAVGKATDGNARMQLRLQPAGEDKSNALKKEVDELRAMVNELQKQVEEMKKK